MKRSSGILMHISSLPSPYGIGTLGRSAFEFVDFLKKAGQKYWQMLPVGPTSYGDSPYQSFSTFAGNPYFIDLDRLQQDGLLSRRDYDSLEWSEEPTAVDYEKIYKHRFTVLYKAYQKGYTRDAEAFNAFAAQNTGWLPNYALYMAVKKHFGMLSWTQWPDERIRLHQKDAVAQYAVTLEDSVNFYQYIQFLFFAQWKALKDYANKSGVQLIGDVPIYVAMDSADTWANPEIFWLDEERVPVCVAGCPPDYFSSTGQLWGNPLYDWESIKHTDYESWIQRIKAASELFDVIRIDHFRGFESYYAIPCGDVTAENGNWMEGPGIEFFDVLRTRLGDIPIIAEDLGYLTPKVRKLLKESGYPGMKVLQFAFDSREPSDYLPHTYDKNCVVYTGTHDNDTAGGWFASAKKDDVDYAVEYLNLTAEAGYVWGLIRSAFASVGNLAVAQMQDFLELGSEARMNVPSTLGNNWEWRVRSESLTDELAERIGKMTKLYGR